MLEEKEVLAEEEKVEEPVAKVEEAPAPADDEQNAKKALTSFILSVVGFVLAWGWIVGGIAGIVLGAISLSMQKKIVGEVTKQPHKVFRKIAKPVAIVDIIAGAIMTVVYSIFFIIWLVGVIVLAAEGAAS